MPAILASGETIALLLLALPCFRLGFFWLFLAIFGFFWLDIPHKFAL
jgi:hypothetical protein